MSKMINTVIRTHSVDLGCPSHLACNIGTLVGIYADIAAKELVLFYDKAGDLVQQQRRRFSYARLPLGSPIQTPAYIVAYGKWKHFLAEVLSKPFTGEAIRRVVENDIRSGVRTPSAWLVDGAWHTFVPEEHPAQAAALLDLQTAMMSAGKPAYVWAEFFRHEFDVRFGASSRDVHRDRAHDAVIQQLDNVHECLVLENCNNPLEMRTTPNHLWDRMDEEFPDFVRKHPVLPADLKKKNEVHQSFIVAIDKLPEWRSVGKWVPEEPIPWLEQERPASLGVVIARPGNVDDRNEDSSGVISFGREPVPVEKEKKAATPKKGKSSSSPKKKTKKNAVEPPPPANEDVSGEKKTLPKKTILQRVLENGRSRAVDNMCVHIGSAQQCFYHWSMRLSDEAGEFFLLWSWSSRAKTQDFLGALAEESRWTVMESTPGQTFVVPIALVGIFGCVLRPNGVPQAVSFVTTYRYTNDEVPIPLDAEEEPVRQEPKKEVSEKIKVPGLSRPVADLAQDGRPVVARTDDPIPSRKRNRSPDDRTSRSPVRSVSNRSSRRSSPSRRSNSGRSRSRSPRERRSRDRGCSPRGRSPEKSTLREVSLRVSDDLLVDFAAGEERTRSVSRTPKKLPTTYRRMPTSDLWSPSSEQPFEIFCRNVWDEVLSYDRGMNTFVEMVGARIPAHVRQGLRELLLLRQGKQFVDSVTHYRIPDLSRTDPVRWLRAATPIVDPEVTGERRLAVAKGIRQKDDEAYHSFHKVLWQALLLAGIHLGWGRRDIRRHYLDALHLALNTPCHQALMKGFPGHIRTNEYADVYQYIDKTDRINRDTRADARTSYVNYLRAELRPTAENLKNEHVSSSGSSKAEVEDRPKTPNGRKALLKENRALASRIEALEASVASSSKTVVAAVVPSTTDKKEKPQIHQCQYCPRGHIWPMEKCWKNPACTTPAEKRVHRERKERKKKTVASITEIDAPSDK